MSPAVNIPESRYIPVNRISSLLNAPHVLFLSGRPADAFGERLNAYFPAADIIELSKEGLLIKPLAESKEEETHTLDRPSPFCLGIVHNGTADELQIERLSNWWSEAIGVVPSICTVSDGSDRSFVIVLSWLTDRMRDDYHVIAERNVRLLRELSTLREFHEKTQRSFAELETLAKMNGLTQIRRDFIIEPDQGVVRIEGRLSSNDGKLRQVLPCSTDGLIAIELNIARAESLGEGSMLIKAIATENEEEVGSWEKSYADLRDGWNLFELERAVDGPRRTLAVSVQTFTRKGSAPALNVGAPHPAQEFWTTGPKGPLTRGTLAIRLYRSIPGTAPSQTVGFSTGANRVHTELSSVFPSHLFKEAQQVSPTPDSNRHSAPTVEVIDAGRALQVHPVPDTVSIARLGPVTLDDVHMIWAEVCTEHPEAKELEYALLVSRGKDSWKDLLTPRRLKSIPGFSGWNRIPPSSPSQVRVLFSAPLSGTHYMFLATRCPRRSDTRYGWARWNRLWAS